MRYTKEIQKEICVKISEGYSVEECSRKYNIPVSVILKWTNTDVSDQDLKTTAVRKYQSEVSEIEARVMGKISEYMVDNLSDDEFVKLSNGVSKELYNLVAGIIRKERYVHSSTPAADENQIIQEIVKKWISNPFLKNYN